MLKIYTLLHDFSLCTPIDVNGRVVTVTFGGGCKALGQNGEYSTTDPDMQYALEHASGYNVTYKLRKTFLTPEDERPADTLKSTEERLPPIESTPKTCVTLNEATEWLVSLGYKKADVSTSAKAISAAKEQGFALKFEKE